MPMSESKNRWALTYRPKNFKEVLGQKHVKEFFTSVLTDWFNKGERLPVGVLFSGHSGVGKTTIARIVAAALNCPSRAGEAPCGACPSCLSILGGLGGGVREIDASSFGLVENMRSLREELMSYSFSGYQVVILDECHKMSEEAFHVLLKLLEEAPPNLFFILITTVSDKILETVKSRLLEFNFQRVPFQEIVEHVKWLVKREGVILDVTLIPKLYKMSKGNVRDLVSNLEQLAIFGKDTINKDVVVEVFGDIYVFEKILGQLKQGSVVDAFEEYKKNSGVYSDFAVFLDGLVEVVGDCFIKAQREGSSEAAFYDRVLSGVYKFCSLPTKLNVEASAKILFFTVFAELFRKGKTDGAKKLGGEELQNSLTD